jgi:peptide/nickel transport system permease protein
VLAYAIRRILAVFPVMAVVVVFVFVLLRLAPGDPAAIIAGDYATPDAIAKIRTALGLDQPIYVQLGVCPEPGPRGSRRHSTSRLPVRTLARSGSSRRSRWPCPRSCSPWGSLLRSGAGGWRVHLIDRAVMVFAVGGFSIPVFWLGFLGSTASRSDWISFRSSAAGCRVPFARHLFLPTLTLGLV